LQAQGEVGGSDGRLLRLEGGLGLDVSLSPPRLAARPQSLNISLKGQGLPLALIDPLTPFLSGLTGQADLDVNLRGSLERPRLEGRADLHGGGLTIVPTGQVVDKIEVAMRLDGRRLLVDKVSARSGGTLSITGEAYVPWAGDPGSCALELTARGIKIGLGSIGEVITDADLHVGGTALNPLVTGPARPSQARILPRLASPSAMSEVVTLKRGQVPPPLRREKRKAPRIILPGPLAPIRMDTAVDLGKGIRVAVDEGWLELAGRTLVRKEPDGPLTFHQGFAIGRGLILAAGKAFEVLPGMTDFDGKDVPDPDLQAKATLRTGTTQIFVNLSGSAFESKLNFSSEPPLSQADILSTIIFGRPARSLSAGESQQLSAQALALLGQRGKAEMERLLGPTLSPDVVAVHNEMQTGPSLEAGKYLGSDLYLRYRQNMGPDGGQNVGLELKLKPYLSLESQVGTTRDNGADVIFSFDFD
jgi:translocation and assembly module TamB